MPAEAAGAAIDIRSLILATLRERSYRPAELLEKLQSKQISEARLKDALAALIEACVIELSPDRHFRLRKVHP